MYVQVKAADGSVSRKVRVSKLTSVKELKALVRKALLVEADRQLLCCRGQELLDECMVFDYHITKNDVVVLTIKPDFTSSECTNGDGGKDEKSKEPAMSKVDSKYYNVGDLVEAVYDLHGGWSDGKIVEIVRTSEPLSDTVPESEDDGLRYMVSFDLARDYQPIGFPLRLVRPRMSTTLKFSDIKVGQRVLVNYNMESPDKRGFWYDMTVTEISTAKESQKLLGTLYVGRQCTKLRNIQILFHDEVYNILKPKLLSERTVPDQLKMTIKNQIKRQSAQLFPVSSEEPKMSLGNSCCQVCTNEDDPGSQLMCGKCHVVYHFACLSPPLDGTPDDKEWFCLRCRKNNNECVEAVNQASKKKQHGKGKRDWNKGMACAGRTKECTSVPPNHFGPIPGVDVGTCWRFRMTASESGVHRPPVAGIHGTIKDGAYSIVLSGGYEDDVDHGEEFYYTGSGGRDLSGNKRTSAQSCDQTLTRMNLALAVSCNAPVNEDEGAEAIDWKGGKPVRVLRNYKLARHSKYAPLEGNRYDGIYKVVKYYPEIGKSGFMVWRYLLRRDDPSPAPWTEEGQKRIKDLGLSMIYPDDFEDTMMPEEAPKSKDIFYKPAAKPKKRQQKSIPYELTSVTPKIRIRGFGVAAYKLDEKTRMIINQDKINRKIWDCCKDSLRDGEMAFYATVKEQFMCVCCEGLLKDPVTTDCHHNICKDCLIKSTFPQNYTCPSCNQVWDKNFELTVNEKLASALLHLFPSEAVW